MRGYQGSFGFKRQQRYAASLTVGGVFQVRAAIQIPPPVVECDRDFKCSDADVDADADVFQVRAAIQIPPLVECDRDFKCPDADVDADADVFQV